MSAEAAINDLADAVRRNTEELERANAILERLHDRPVIRVIQHEAAPLRLQPLADYPPDDEDEYP